MSWLPLERVGLDELLFRQRHAVASLRSALQRELSQEVDDVWLLRYALSFEDDLPGAEDAAKKALAWRKDNARLVEAARNREAPADLTDEELSAIHAFFVAAFHCCTEYGDPVFLSRLCAYDLNALMSAVPEAKLELWFNFTNECSWQYCEAETRRRRYFVKQINIQDSAGLRMAQNRPFLRALGNSSKVNDWLRPQLFGKTFVFNPPVWLSMAHRVAGGFMSRKSLEKVWVHPGKVNATTGAEKGLCPFARQLLGGGEALPSFLGGLADADAFPDGPRQRRAVARRNLPILAALPAPHPPQDEAPERVRKMSRERRDSEDVESVSGFHSVSNSVAGSKQELPVSLSLSMCSAVTAREFAEEPTESSRPSICRRVCFCLRRRPRLASRPLIP